MADRLSNLYPTTLLHRRLDGMEETNRQLIKFITEISAHEINASEGTTTEGGYQTREDLLARPHPAILAIKRHIEKAVHDYSGVLIRQECSRAPAHVDIVLWAWAVILKAGSLQSAHVHPTANISGVYYVAVPPAVLERGRDNGKIIFYDPRPRANMSQLARQITRHRETPMPGDMIVFPSWLEHSVPAFDGPGERICIAFNARLTLS